MTWKQKWRRGATVLGAVLFLIALSAPATAGAAPQYPDLRPLPPTDAHLGTEFVNGENHYVVRLSSYMHNMGQGPFELHGTPHLLLPDGTFDVSQWIFDETGGTAEQLPVGTFYYHREHGHFHFDDFARYELWSERDFRRAEARKFKVGKPLYKSGKISFCLQDSTRIDDDAPEEGTYGGCSPLVQGISKGWADLYDYQLDGQWVDVGERPLADGTYVLRSVGDPTNKLYESPGKADPARDGELANSSASFITIKDGQLAPPPE